VNQFRVFEDLVSHLEEEKSKNPTMIPYKLAIFDHYPQHIVLAYLPPSRENKIVKEFIKVKPRGYQFHDTHFPSIDHLIGYFKENFTKVDYRR